MTNTPNDASQSGAVENQIELREVEGLSQGQIVRRRFFHHKGAVVALVVLIGIVALAITSIGIGIGGWQGWYAYKPSGQGSTYPLVNGGAPSEAHIFGQDEAGRDVFARVMQGTQTSLLVVLSVGVIATIAGVLVGALSGYYRGRTDSWLMRFTDLIITMPVIVIGAVLALLSGGSNALILGAFLGLVLWPPLARLVRGEFLSLREREFVDAARVAGASDTRIIFKHMLPNAVGVIIVNVTLLMSSAILLETALSYLGVGIQAPATSLGKLISDYQEAFATRPWLFWWPGLFIVAIALCVNFIGDGLRDAFDPRQKRIPSERKMARAQRVARPTAATAPSATGEAGAS
ncbi:ABC transporter permease [Cellulosimicrobium funkei]|uniref:ABC transporter permease n=1 Tax=Cellulosimicrobium funkei TaxID=264251 RepID=UPI0037DD2CFB